MAQIHIIGVEANANHHQPTMQTWYNCGEIKFMLTSFVYTAPLKNSYDS